MKPGVASLTALNSSAYFGEIRRRFGNVTRGKIQC